MELPSTVLLLFLVPMVWGSFIHDLSQGLAHKNLNSRIEKNMKRLIPDVDHVKVKRDAEAEVTKPASAEDATEAAAETSTADAATTAATKAVTKGRGSSFGIKPVMKFMQPYLRIVWRELEAEVNILGKAWEAAGKGIRAKLVELKSNMSKKTMWYMQQMDELKTSLFRIATKYLVQEPPPST